MSPRSLSSGTLGMVEDGPVETEQDLPVIDLVAPIAGFPEHRRFALVRLDDAGVLSALRSVDDPALRFLVVPPAPFFPEYEPEIDEQWAERLQLNGDDDVLVLLIVTPGATAAESTANLLAPVMVNTRTRVAAQVLLDGNLPLKAPLAA
ncbi:MAG: flagellar assembly protein FliW [Motilibacteraceae bacterium]